MRPLCAARAPDPRAMLRQQVGRCEAAAEAGYSSRACGCWPFEACFWQVLAQLLHDALSSRRKTGSSGCWPAKPFRQAAGLATPRAAARCALASLLLQVRPHWRLRALVRPLRASPAASASAIPTCCSTACLLGLRLPRGACNHHSLVLPGATRTRLSSPSAARAAAARCQWASLAQGVRRYACEVVCSVSDSRSCRWL